MSSNWTATCIGSRLRLKCDGTRAETRFRLSAKRTSPFKSAGASVQSTTDSRGVRISGSNVGYTMFRGSVTGTGYLLHSPVSPSLPLPCVTVCHHVSIGFLEAVTLPHSNYKRWVVNLCLSTAWGQRGSEGTAPIILNLDLRRKWFVSCTFQPLFPSNTPTGKPPVADRVGPRTGLGFLGNRKIPTSVRANRTHTYRTLRK
jgi:hypothetical protein